MKLPKLTILKHILVILLNLIYALIIVLPFSQSFGPNENQEGVWTDVYVYDDITLMIIMILPIYCSWGLVQLIKFRNRIIKLLSESIVLVLTLYYSLIIGLFGGMAQDFAPHIGILLFLITSPIVVLYFISDAMIYKSKIKEDKKQTLIIQLRKYTKFAFLIALLFVLVKFIPEIYDLI